jgi:nucleotide-binding universal stress UspA family protein
MKNILLMIHDDEGQEARYQAALDIARQVDGHVRCLHLTTIIPEFARDYVLLVNEQNREEANREQMLPRIEAENVPYERVDVTGFIARSIEDHAALIDLIVLSSDAQGAVFPHMADAIADLLIGLGKPILVVPTTARSFDLHSRVLVAWDGSPNAEAALTASIPLLRHAADVTLVHIDDKSLKLPIEDAATYLSRHQITSTIKRIAPSIGSAGKAILTEAVRGHYDYVILGAYGHGPTIEKIFGGTTHRMLHSSPISMLLAHRR